MAQRYIPPKQSAEGQFIDVIVVLVLVFGALLVPYLFDMTAPSRVEKLPAGLSYTMQTNADGSESKVWTGLTWEALGQNPVMQQQWEKLGYTPETAADIITMPFEYEVDIWGLLVTILVIIGYYVYVLYMSGREYRDIIREKFD